MKKQNNVSKLASSLLLTALLPSPSFGIPSPPAGLYDVMIESNCFNWPEQNNIRNGSWQVKRVSVWPGQTSIHMRTVSDTDTVSFSTSHPHLVQLPPTMQLPGPIGGILYTRKSSFISFNEPSQPTNIEVNVHSSHPADKSYTLELLQQAASTVLFAALTEGPSNVSLDPGSAWRNRGKDIKRLRLYPPLEFMGLVSPIKNKTIEVDTPVTYSADYSYANANNGPATPCWMDSMSLPLR